MATLIDEIKEDKDIALKEYRKAEDKLKKFEDGENGGKWLDELRGKTRRKERLDEDDKRQLAELKEEEERLKKNVNDWGKQVQDLQKALANFGKGEGNEQIA